MLERTNWLMLRITGAGKDVMKMTQNGNDFEVVVIGSGFGGAMSALTIARQFKNRQKGERLLILERGAWWTTPVETIQDKPINTRPFLGVAHGQPVRVWPSADHLRGLVDVFLRCFRRPGQEDGLYEMSLFGKADASTNDGVAVTRANGVGGGSLIYANMTIEPPSSVFAKWPVTWDNSGSGDPKDHHTWYDLARHAIGYGVLSAWTALEGGLIPYVGNNPPKEAVNTGLSNIASRTARLDPQWKTIPDPKNPNRIVRQIDPSHYTHKPDNMNDLWIDRPRVLQTAAAKVIDQLHLSADFGTADSSINDLTPEGTSAGKDKPPVNYPPFNSQPKNYCERQGRCILGCLPGARQTLNKQLMIALWGTPPDDYPVIPPQIGDKTLQVRALAEVKYIKPKDGNAANGYEVHYAQRSDDLKGTTDVMLTADRVIVAAGCIGTNQLMLECKQKFKTLPNLSDKLGFGFSTNGDYLAYIEDTTETINLSRGPVQTSYAHFYSDQPKFHTIEDMGLPKVFSVLYGKGILRRLSTQGITKSLLVTIAFNQINKQLKQVISILASVFKKSVSPDEFESEDIPGRRIMGVAGIGLDAAVGQFRLGGPNDTVLRVKRTDGLRFDQDPIYTEIKKTLDMFSKELTGSALAKHKTPFTRADEKPVVGVAHPLGGCKMANNISEGVVDEYGKVFGYDNLHIVDAAIVPTALGVNPSLTISALALRAAYRIVKDHYNN
jgi:choline dehydrogenase-like flavoprotein